MGARVLIAGGGIAGMEAALGLGELGPDGTEVVLVTPAHELLHQDLGDVPWSMGRVVRHPLDRVCEALGAELIANAVASVAPAERTVTLYGGKALAYDALLVAVGARRIASLDHALLFGSMLDAPAVDRALDLVRGGEARGLGVVVPPGLPWSLPAYEVALHARAAGGEAVVVTPEDRPAAVFGSAAEAVERVLAENGVRVVRGTAVDIEPECIVLHNDRRIAVDEIVALPWTRGRPVPGLPADADGYLPTDAFQAVDGVDGVYGAGDCTTFPVRQGGIASQQGAVAAASVAAALGADVTPAPLRAVLRGTLPTPDGPLWLEHDLTSGRARASREPLWEPVDRIAGVRLPELLARLEA